VKILFLTDGLAPFVIGGMQQHSTMMVKHLAPMVEEIAVMHCGYPDEAPASDSEVLEVLGPLSNVNVVGIPFIDNSSFPGHYVRASKAYSLNLYNTVSNDLSSFDVVYAQGFTGYAFIGKHKKLVSNLHGLNMFQRCFSLREKSDKILLKPLARKILLNSSHVISLGGNLTDTLLKLGVNKKQIVVSQNGIESKYILSSSEVKQNIKEIDSKFLRIIFIGRNDTVKGLHILRQVLAKLPSPVHLTLVGEVGPIESKIHTIENLGVIKSKDELFKLIDTSHALVVPSLSEGMPTVILEAMARGKAIIATDVGAVSELVGECNGRLIPPNDVKALADAISNIKSDFFEKRSNISLSKVTSFTWGAIAVKFLDEIKLTLRNS
jgi:glycosyltransferase involved in cell wall biosynthesis